jgi:hypothetical protein
LVPVVVPENRNSSFRLISWMIRLKLPASDNPLFDERIPHHDYERMAA